MAPYRQNDTSPELERLWVEKNLKRIWCQINVTSPLNFSKEGKTSFWPSDNLQTPKSIRNTCSFQKDTRCGQHETDGRNSQARSETKPATSPFDFMHFLAQLPLPPPSLVGRGRLCRRILLPLLPCMSRLPSASFGRLLVPEIDEGWNYPYCFLQAIFCLMVVRSSDWPCRAGLFAPFLIIKRGSVKTSYFSLLSLLVEEELWKRFGTSRSLRRFPEFESFVMIPR